MPLLLAVEKTTATGDAADYVFWCPGCKCGHGVWTSHPNGVTGATWQFNGNMQKPTFQPSLLIRRTIATPPVTPENIDEYNEKPWPQKDVEHICHVVVTDGILHFCSDCTHEFANKAVPLQEFP